MHSLPQLTTCQRRWDPGAYLPDAYSLLITHSLTLQYLLLPHITPFIILLHQVSCHAPAPWAAGSLLLLSEVLKAHPGLWAALQQPEDMAAAAEVFRDAPDDNNTTTPTAAAAAAAARNGGAGGAGGVIASDDDEEVFRDVDDSGDEGKPEAAAAAAGKQQKQKQKAAAAAAAVAAAAAAGGGGKWPKEGCYDMRKR